MRLFFSIVSGLCLGAALLSLGSFIVRLAAGDLNYILTGAAVVLWTVAFVIWKDSAEKA